MNNEQELHYVETDEDIDVKRGEEPRTKGILSLIFGIASIVLGGIVGIVLGALARRFSSPILADLAGTATAKLARAGRITGTVGLILSIISVVVVICIVIAVICIIFMLMPTMNIGAISF